MSPKIRSICKNTKQSGELTYAGRAPSASTATGYHKLHDAELKHFLQEALKR